jgi:tetratricopeptide (TPR) repeat protein
LRKAAVLEPENPDPRYLLIQAYYRNFEYERALSLAQETLAHFPDRALSNYHLGAQLNNFSRLDEAKQQLDLALAKDSGLVEAQAMLGDVLFKMGKADESLSYFRKALAADPKLMDAHAGLGKALIQLKRYAEAAGAMEEAIKIDPKLASIHLYLSQAYRALGRADDAKKEAAVFSVLNQERANVRDREGDRKYPN